MRLAAAIGVIAITVAAAVYVHQRHHYVTVILRASSGNCDGYFQDASCKQALTETQTVRSSWQDPTAVLLSLGGIAVVVGILTARRRNIAKPS